MARVRRSGSGGSVFPDFSVYNDATHKIKCQDMWTNISTDNGWASARLNIQTDIKAKLVGSNTFKYFEAPEDCFVCAQGHFSTAANSNAENGIMFMVAESKDAEYAYKYSGWDQSQVSTEFAATIPLRKGNIVFGLSDGLYGSDVYTWWVPMSATPAKISELYMGAPDYENAINLITEGICTSSGINGWEVPEDGFLVAPMVTLSSGSDLDIWINGSTIDASPSVQIGHFSIGHDNGGIYVLRKGDKLYAAVSNNSTSVVVNGIDTGSGATRILFCPRRKIRIDASDIVASGSGGVLDGSLYTLSNGLTYKEVTDVAVNADAASLVYTVENDCGLYMEDEAYDPSGTTHSDIECNYWFDAAMTKPIFKHNQTDASFKDVDGTATVIVPNPESCMSFQGTIAYVKAGTKIYASSNYYESKTGTNHRFRFYEYKLSSIAPQIAMPDYSRGVTQLKASGTAVASGDYVMPANGWLLCANVSTSGSGSVVVTINDIYVGSYIYDAGQYSDYQQVMYPVSKGDVVKITVGSGSTNDLTSYQTLDFIYAKAVPATTVNGLVSVPDWDNSKKIDVSAAMTGDTWTAPADGWLTGNFHSDSSTTSSGVTVNGAMVFNDLGGYECGPFVIPLAKNDEVKFTGQVTFVLFYPAKLSNQPSDCVSYVVESGRFCSSDGTVHATASENDAWYRLYSDGWCEQGGYSGVPVTSSSDTKHQYLYKHIQRESLTITATLRNSVSNILPMSIVMNPWDSTNDVNGMIVWTDSPGSIGGNTVTDGTVNYYWKVEGFVV